MPAPTRERIITTTTELFRRQGYAATGVKQIVAGAEAAFGSVYHFFPGGKEQLAEEVVRTSGATYGDLVDLFERVPAGTPVDIVEQAGHKLDTILIPKAGVPADVYLVDAVVTQIEMAKGLLASGKAPRDVAKAFGVGRSTLYRYVPGDTSTADEEVVQP